MSVPVVFTTERSARHQDNALQMAPDGFAITMLRAPDTAQLHAALAGARYLISERRGEIGADLLDASPDLAMVLRLGSMAHDIDLSEAARRNIIVCQRSQEGAMRVAEHLMLQILALLKRLMETEAIARAAADDWAERHTTDENTFAFNWSRQERLYGLHDSTVGILGFGEIGAELARRLAGWRCNILYHRRTRLPEQAEAQLGVSFCSREELAARSGVVVCLLPYTPQTQVSVDASLLAHMKPGALLASAGSGGVIDEQALAQAVLAGHLAGAAVDTFAVEPIESGNPLVIAAREGANMLLTPHVAGGAPDDGWQELADMYGPIQEHLAGQAPSGRLV